MLEWLKKVFDRRPAGRETIVVDDWGVRREMGDGRKEELAWESLVEVQIVTTDQGPFVDDVFFLLGGSDGTGVCVTQGAEGSEPLLDRLQKLPGFDNDQVIKAMSCSENARFVCWKKPA